jgi:propionyl-CoA carboxylase alpha chain
MLEKPKIDTQKFILAPMPGTVVSLAVQVGDIVAEGMEVAVVEAMKMQNVLHAAQGGRIKAIHVKEGGTVQASEVMIEIEDAKGK